MTEHSWEMPPSLPSGLNTEIPLSAKHAEFAIQCKEPGWEELQPTLFLAPKEVIQSMSGWLHMQL